MLKEIFKVFTKEYKEETKYLEYCKKMRKKILLENNENFKEDDILRFNSIESKCSIKISNE